MRAPVRYCVAIFSVAVTLMSVAITSASANAGGSVVFSPGAPGVGDPYFPGYGNGGYDVEHYDLDITFSPATDQLTGRAVISARATQNLSRFNLDLVGLTVDSITVDGRGATWSRSGQELSITPPSGLRRGRPFTVAARYHGIPETFEGHFFVGGVVRTDDGVMIGGQPEVAAAWFPVNDHPQDKASYTVTVTVPAGLEAISNGIPLGNRTVNGWTTWRWAQLTPMASYLTMAAIGDFDIRRSIHNGRPMILAFDPDLPAGLADDAVGRTGEMTDFLAGHFGPYPFEANGGIVDETIGFFALEHQSRPTYGELFFEPGPTNLETYVVVHELAHQWFGDSVAVQEWDDIWLNEGFATYAEWLWSDHIGDGSPQDLFDFYYAQPVTEDYWSPAPGDPGAEQVLDYSVYVRGAMTLHALRMTVGDADFDRIIRGWYLRNRNGNGATAEFISLAEHVSGQQLDGLFHDWLFTDVKPPHPGGGVSAQPSAPLTAVRSLQVRLSTGWR